MAARTLDEMAERADHREARGRQACGRLICGARAKPRPAARYSATVHLGPAAWAAWLPAGSACAASLVPATGLSLRSPRAVRDFSRNAGALWCRLRRRCAGARRETSCAAPGRPVMRAPPARRLPPDRREATAPPGPVTQPCGHDS